MSNKLKKKNKKRKYQQESVEQNVNLNPFFTAMYVPPKKEYRFRPTDKRRWLPLFYLIPLSFFGTRPKLLEVPRCPHDIVRTKKYDKLINSDIFEEFVLEAYAQYIWKFIQVPRQDGTYRNIPGSVNSYSGYSSLWKLPYGMVGYIIQEMDNLGHGIEWLFHFTYGVEHRWITEEEFETMIGKFVKLIVPKENLQPMIDILWETRTMEDFDGYSNLMIDAQRKWYHTRAKTKMVSFEQIMRREANDDYPISQSTLLSISDPFAEFESTVVTKDMLKPFIDTLTDEDMQMLVMRSDGYKLQEIADALGLQTHSAVSKRLKKLGERYEDFVGDEFVNFLKDH